MSDDLIADAKSTTPVERLLEDSWADRSVRANRREQLIEGASSLLFLAVSVPLAVAALSAHGIDVLLVVALLFSYALCAGLVRFPIGAGYVVPSYMVLVPMLLLLPPGTVPALAAVGLVLGTAAQRETWKTDPRRIAFAVSDAWHTLGPVTVLLVAGAGAHHGAVLVFIYVGAFVAGCLTDLAAATVSEAAINGIETRVQLRVVAVVWLIDACVAPLGLLVALGVKQHRAEILLILPLNALLVLLSRERTARINQAQQRLDLLARERIRLQKAVGRLADALTAKLDLDALIEIVLHGSLEALDADAGRIILKGGSQRAVATAEDGPLLSLLDAVAQRAFAERSPARVEGVGLYALALPFSFKSMSGNTDGVLCVARRSRAFRADEEEVMRGLVERTRVAAEQVTSHQALFEQAHTDVLTGLGNRRRLEADLPLQQESAANPIVLIMFDLDGFKSYNDTFGHLAGDALLARLATKLHEAVAERGGAYRLGGDEFCVLVSVEAGELAGVVSASAAALEERGERFSVAASYGAVAIPHEATNLDYALQLADERMYTRKRGRASRAGDQARDVLMRIMHAKQPSLEGHVDGVARLCRLVGQRLGMTTEQLDELVRAAELHDVGKVGIPDAILEKPAPLDESEWQFMRQHTILGERILNAAPALRPVATLVRASHERWDGSGYPDGLAGEQIPLGARIIAACDAYDAITSDRVYRRRRDAKAGCRELRKCAGRQFDPLVIDALLTELESSSELPSATPAARQHGRGDRREQLAAEVASQLRIVIERGVQDARAGALELSER